MADTSNNKNIRKLSLVLGLTATVFVAEVIGSFWTKSLALAADAGHMLVDSAGLIIALIAAILATRPRSNNFTWGLARIEIISAALQAGVLLTVCVFVAIEAVKRFFSQPEILAPQMAIFGVIGLLANVIALFILRRHKDSSLNMRAAFLEVANDALGSVGVLVAALVTALTGWGFADSIASLLIAGLMGPRAVRMLATSVGILLEKTPSGLDLDKVRQHILSQEHVLDVHDLHASTVSTNNIVLYAHVTLPEQCFTDGHSIEILHNLQECLSTHFPIAVEHCTFQLDTPHHRDHEQLKHQTAHLDSHSH